MLTGKLPTTQDTAIHNSLGCASATSIPSLREFNTSLSPALVAIVDRCLHSEPTRRYPTARDLYDDLMAQLESKPLVHQPEPSSAERIRKWFHRHPRLSSAGTIASIAGVLLIATALALVARGRQLLTADWQRRWTQIELLEPETISYLTATDLAPELIPEATGKLHQLVGLVAQINRPEEVDQAFLNSNGPKERERLETRLSFLLALGAGVDTTPRDRAAPGLIYNLKKQLQSRASSQSTSDTSATDSYLKGDFTGASVALQTQLQASQQDYASWLMLGNCHAGLQDHAAAQQCYTACMALRPAIAVPQFFRGISRLQSGQFEAAIDDFNAVAKRQTDWTSAYFNRALAEQALGRFEDALSSLNLAIERGDRSVQAYSVRAQIHATLGRVSEQQADIASALAAKPRTEEDWIVHALLNLDAGKTDAAVEELGQALVRFPNSLDARQNLAHIYSDVANQPNLAMQQMEALIQADPGNPMRLAGRAVLLARQGQIEPALEDLRQATAGDPKLPIIQYQIASCYSLIANHQELKGVNDDRQRAELDRTRKFAQSWFAKSILHDPQLMAIIETDADFVWFRKQPEYSVIRNAIAVLTKAEQREPSSIENLQE